MQILLTNDDGFHAPGIVALERKLTTLGDVVRVAPATEQSGVGHSITFLSPLVCKKVFDRDRFLGWAVDGSPADCVKLGVFELSPRRPDLVVSGINGGLNAGINILYSGTVAAAIEGAFFGITSIAVSLEYDEHADFDLAARIAVDVIRQILAHKDQAPQLYNLNMPTAAIAWMSQEQIDPTRSVPRDNAPELRIVPMGVNRYGEHFDKRQDPKGRDYYWATHDPPPKPTPHPTDLSELAAGHITLTALDYDLTKSRELETMHHWGMQLPRKL